MAKYYHVSFNFEGRKAPTDAITQVLNKALDWVNYAPNCWIIYSRRDEAEHWYTRLKKIVHNDDSIFVCELNIENKQGWLPTNVWDWLNKNRDG